MSNQFCQNALTRLRISTLKRLTEYENSRLLRWQQFVF